MPQDELNWTEVDQFDAIMFVVGKTIKSQGPTGADFPGDRVTWFTDGTALSYREYYYSPGYSEWTPSTEIEAQWYKGEKK